MDEQLDAIVIGTDPAVPGLAALLGRQDVKSLGTQRLSLSGTAVQHGLIATVMHVDFLPEHLVIVGGGYIGLEFAQMYRRFGSRVTVVGRAEKLLPREDDDVAAEIRAILEREGVEIRTGAECIGFEKRAD